ncbi:MAG TPA: ABC transporter ATP-binding protein [Acidimicrobiales bacterium]|nr:ABC transporter ATP-binding protein [Acidimicrobiales bacterium]
MTAVTATEAEPVLADAPPRGAAPGAGLVLDDLAKRFGPVRAVDGVSLDIPAGTLVSFLGPSGCGKTTLLRMIAGLERPSAGRIVVSGADVTARPAHKRDIGMVFQSLALFPHLDVRRNIGYPLRVKGQGRSAVAARVDELMALVHLDGLGRRPVRKLSGGQRQRVAIARALACNPSLFLLDEPMSALDANLREALQVELRLLQQRLGITTVMVTHDQREAMTMSDVVVVMQDGRVEQSGPPLAVYRRPATAFVARFMGATNLLPARVAGRAVKVAGRLIAVPRDAHGKVTGADILLSLRPGDASVGPYDDAAPSAPDSLVGEVVFVRDLGTSFECFVDCGLDDGPLVAAASAPGHDHRELAQGDRVAVHLPPDRCVVVAP